MTVRQRARQSLSLLYGLVKRDLLIMARYPINTAGAILGLYGLFLVVYFGGQSLVGGGFDDTLGALIIGFFLFIMGNVSYKSLASAFAAEAKWGTLERLYLSPVGFGWVAILLSVSSLVTTFLMGFSILALMLLTTGQQLSLDVVSILPILVFTLMTTAGLGLLFGGATVRYKQIGAVFSLAKFAFVGLIALGPLANDIPLLKVLPLVQGSLLLQRVMDDGVRLWDLAVGELAVLVVVGVGYFLAGYLLLRAFTERARETGVMGHY